MTPPGSCSPPAAAAGVPIRVHLASGATRISLLGTPGPEGKEGPPGDKGDQGAPGITILPTDTPINGGFF